MNVLTRINTIFLVPFQQQIHAQQIPGAPPQIPSALGPLGPLGAFGGPMGLPHGPQSLLKNPQDLHREDIKVPLAGPSAEERLVSNQMSNSDMNQLILIYLSTEKFSITSRTRKISTTLTTRYRIIWLKTSERRYKSKSCKSLSVRITEP